MTLELKELLPTYFSADRCENSGIWGKNLRFDKGRRVKIVAPSGSGKTSLMHFLYGMRKDYQGQISYSGRSLGSFTPVDLAGLRAGALSIVFQDLRLFPEQTVQQNLEIKRHLNPFHPPEKIAEMAERLGIGSKLQSRCGTCSYGEQQRVAIIRSLLQPFEILLLDEPYSHLDEANSKKAMELILEEAALRQATIVFADLERIDYFPYDEIYYL